MGFSRALGYAATLAAVCLTGCDQQSSAADKLDVDILKTRVNTLQQQLLNSDSERIKLRTAAMPAAILRLSDDGFSILHTDLGNITVQMTASTPAGAGTRVSLRVGNPLGAAITKLGVSGSWGPLDADGKPVMEDEHAFSTVTVEPIASGRWSLTSILIEGAKPDKVGFVLLEDATAKSIELTAPG